MYYEEDLTQAEIARRTGYSRSMISRFLTEAKRQGVVEIRVHHPMARRTDLEQALRRRFSLERVRVLDCYSHEYPARLRRVGMLAARLVEETVMDHMTIGMSWGTGLAEMVQACRPQPRDGVLVVQIIGSMGTANPNIDGSELARQLAHVFGGRYRILPTPLIVEDESVRHGLRSDRQVREVLDHAWTMDLALVGVGTVEREYSSLVRSGYLRPEELNEFAEAGAVGDVCTIHFDIYGNLIDIPLQRRFVGIDYDTLVRVPIRIGIAAGQPKAQAILGALRAGMINVLVTDDVAANHVLRLAEWTERGDGQPTASEEPRPGSNGERVTGSADLRGPNPER
ncbi:MAG: sugar-binding transcriptional regulator [Chloroflexi bacterium]|nr:sugar-binding transcriptional regulator [Chloroflexota bacterium]